MKIYDVIKRGFELEIDDEYGSWYPKDVEKVLISFEKEEDAKAFVEKYPDNLRILERELVLHSEFDINESFGVFVKSETDVSRLTNEELEKMRSHLSPGGNIDKNLSIQVAMIDNIVSVEFGNETVFSKNYDVGATYTVINFETGISVKVLNIDDFVDSRYEIYTFIKDSENLAAVGPKEVIYYYDYEEGQKLLGTLKTVATEEFAEKARTELDKESDIVQQFSEVPDLKRILTNSIGYSENNGELRVDFDGGISIEISKEAIFNTEAVAYHTKVFHTSNMGNETEIPNMGLSFILNDVASESSHTEGAAKLQRYIDYLSDMDGENFHFDKNTHFADEYSLYGVPNDVKFMIRAYTRDLMAEKENLFLEDKYPGLFKIDNTGKLAEFIDSSALTYEEGGLYMQIAFENGNGVCIYDCRQIIPYQIEDGQFQLLEGKAVDISELSTQELINTLEKIKDEQVEIEDEKDSDICEKNQEVYEILHSGMSLED